LGVMTFTQVLLVREPKNGEGIIGWVETRFAVVGKLVQDDDGNRWRVTERYATWPKARLDAQRQEGAHFREVLH
jgi:hypothetical protein